MSESDKIFIKQKCKVSQIKKKREEISRNVYRTDKPLSSLDFGVIECRRSIFHPGILSLMGRKRFRRKSTVQLEVDLFLVFPVIYLFFFGSVTAWDIHELEPIYRYSVIYTLLLDLRLKLFFRYKRASSCAQNHYFNTATPSRVCLRAVHEKLEFILLMCVPRVSFHGKCTL